MTDNAVQIYPNNGKYDLWIGKLKVLTFVTMHEILKYLEEASYD